MVTLAQFREITEGLPGDFEIRIEACFTPEGNKTASCFEMMYSKETKEVVLLPEAVHINDGETGLTVKHEEKPRKTATKQRTNVLSNESPDAKNRSGRAIQQQEENGSSRTDFLLIYKVFSFTVLVMGISKSTKYIFIF